MYPCSDPELVAAVSAAAGIGVVQPLSMIYVYRHDLREGLRMIRRTTGQAHRDECADRTQPLYLERMRRLRGCRAGRGGALLRHVARQSALGGGTAWPRPGIVPRRDRANDKALAGGVARPDRAWRCAAPSSSARNSTDSRCRCVSPRHRGRGGSLRRCRWAMPVPSSAPGSSPRSMRRPWRLQAGDRRRPGADDIVLTERVTGVPLAVVRPPT